MDNYKTLRTFRDGRRLRSTRDGSKVWLDTPGRERMWIRGVSKLDDETEPAPDLAVVYVGRRGLVAPFGVDPRKAAREVAAWLRWYQGEVARRSPPSSPRRGRPRKATATTWSFVGAWETRLVRSWRAIREAKREDRVATVFQVLDWDLDGWLRISPDAFDRVVEAIERRLPSTPLALAVRLVAAYEGVSRSTVTRAK